jgi:hypothetical protein
MKKKIKDLTIGEFISIARKSKDLQKCSGDACSECPLANVDDLECWNFCSKRQCLRERIDNILNQEIEVEEVE